MRCSSATSATPTTKAHSSQTPGEGGTIWARSSLLLEWWFLSDSSRLPRGLTPTLSLPSCCCQEPPARSWCLSTRCPFAATASSAPQPPVPEESAHSDGLGSTLLARTGDFVSPAASLPPPPRSPYGLSYVRSHLREKQLILPVRSIRVMLPDPSCF